MEQLRAVGPRPLPPVKPSTLPPLPPGLRVPEAAEYSPHLAVDRGLEDFAARRAQTVTAEENAFDSFELESVVVPLLRQRYGESRNLDVVELGPSCTTGVARALHGRGNRYVAVDLSAQYLEKQREFLADEFLLADVESVVGDTYALPLAAASADLLVAECHTPLVSGSVEALVRALNECARVLRPGGEFVLNPYYAEKQPPEATKHLLDLFELVHVQETEPGRRLLVLRKR